MNAQLSFIIISINLAHSKVLCYPMSCIYLLKEVKFLDLEIREQFLCIEN